MCSLDMFVTEQRHPRSARAFSRVVMYGSMCLLPNPRRRAPVESGPQRRARRGISRCPPCKSWPHACVAAPTCSVVHGTEPYGGGAVGTLRSADSGSAEAGFHRCEAVTFSLADGAAAGQDVPHTHLHLVPRRTGDGLVWGTAGQLQDRETLDAIASQLRTALGRS